MTRRHGDVS